MANMLRITLTSFFCLCSIMIRLGSGLCPGQCKCDETRLRSDCSEGELDIVPIFLNPRTKYLEANRNQIRHLEGALNVYEDLEVLDLSNNEFHSLGQMQFASQLKLQQLNLSNNFVASLHSNTFVGPRALQTLDLSHNILGAIHNDTFNGLTSLVELRLSHNKIGSISSEAFSGLSRLRVLNLDHNLLESIDPTWMFALENLRFFYLNNNLISHIADDSFRPLSALKVLSVLRNRIFKVSQFAFRGLRSLDTLDLSDNLLPHVPNEALSQLQQLLRLYLSGNPIVEIQRQSFQSLFTLEELNLSRMPKLEAVGGHSLMDNTNLKKLTLENNPVLSPLPWGLFATNGLLQDVSYRNNSWTTLAVQQVPHQSLRNLQIEGLPFHCNCSLIWLWELYQRQNETNIKLDSARCATRPSSASDGGNSGVSELELMSPDQLACDDWTHVLVIISASVLGVAFLLLAASLCLYKFRMYTMRSKYGGTPCFHIKDDTMIYRGTLGSPTGPFKTLPVSEPDQSGSYSPTEPFYEVPKYGDEDPKSSSASSGSKYSSSGYVGSELWENEYFTTGQSPAHCYVNPTTSTPHNQGNGMSVHSRTLQRNYGGSPQSSSSVMGSGSGSSTVSNGSTRLFFSPAHHGSPRMAANNGFVNNHRGNNTLMWMHGSPHHNNSNSKQFVPMDKFSTARCQFQQHFT